MELEDMVQEGLGSMVSMEGRMVLLSAGSWDGGGALIPLGWWGR